MIAPPSAWHNLDSKQQVDELLRRFRGFHDALLRELKLQSGSWCDESGMCFASRSHARCVFQGGPPDLPCIELVFLDLLGLHLCPRQSDFDPIDEACISLTADGLLWNEPQSGAWIRARAACGEPLPAGVVLETATPP